MIYKCFLMLLLLNLVAMFARAEAGEIDPITQELYGHTIEADAGLDEKDCILRVAKLISKEQVERVASSLGVDSSSTGADTPIRNFGDMMDRARYRFKLSDDNVGMRMTIRF